MLDHNHEKTVFAVQEFVRRENVFIYSTCVNRIDTAKPIKVHKFPPHLLLVSSHEGLLYFVSDTSTGNSFYAAFRENVEVKQRYLGFSTIDEACISNIFFGCFGFVNIETFLLVTDLSTDTILFRRPLTDINLKLRCPYISPVVNECSDFQSIE